MKRRTTMRTKTFQELCDEMGLANVFSGTDADATIRAAFLEWLFDYRLCDPDDTVFLRYFRRRFNNLYPRYLEQLRILTIKGNMDPFVTVYYQDLLDKQGQENGVSVRNTVGSSNGASTTSNTGGSVTVRTPNLRNEANEESEHSKQASAHNSGRDVSNTTSIQSGDEHNFKSHSGTDNLVGTQNVNDTSNKSGTNTAHLFGTSTDTKTGYDSSQHTGQDTDVTDGRTERHTSTEAQDNTGGKSSSVSDNIGIAYPEANLGNGSIPLNIGEASKVASMPSNRSVNYAQTETIGLNKAYTEGSGSSSNSTDEETTEDTKVTRNYDSQETSNYNSQNQNSEDKTNSETFGESVTDIKNATNNENKTYNDSTTEANQHAINSIGSDETNSTTDEESDESGTESKVSTNILSGNENTTVTDNKRAVTSNNNVTDESENASNDVNTSEITKNVHKGRNETVADIIPRAVRAIISTNELMWFIDSMKVCFDCVD